MLPRKLVAIVWVLGFLGLSDAALAQSDARKTEDKTLVDRLDNLGKTIFGAFLPADKPKPKDVATPRIGSPSSKHKSAEANWANDNGDMPPARSGRAGSVLTEPAASDRRAASNRMSDDSIAVLENDAAVSPVVEGASKRVRRPTPTDAPQYKTDSVEIPATKMAMNVSEASRPAESAPWRPEASMKTGARPLHERLSGLRRSVFDSEGAQQSSSEPNQTDPPPAPAFEPSKQSAAAIVAQREKPAPDAVAAEPILEPASKSRPVGDKAITGNKPISEPSKKDDGGVLIARKGPVLSVETLGPRRIAIGKESVYEVSILNSGEVAADELVVFVSLPEWAEVAGAEASRGIAQASGSVQWNLGHLDAKGRERLTLRIIPRQSRPFDLAVRWDYKPVASQAMIEVQEPKLALQLEGPREVLYGKKEIYRLKLVNAGTGGAENVVIVLMPVGGGENVPATHKIGLLAASEEKILDVELTARQPGNLTIRMEARADGGVRAELAEKVMVRRADLKVNVEGPKVQYVGVATTYAIRVCNPGTAPAQNVNLSISLPDGVKYLSGLKDARQSDSGNKLEWTVDAIPPEAEQTFVLKCSLGATGASRIQVNATANDGLSATGAAVTRVEAVANLVMDVKDPESPMAVGEEAVYEIRVRNRGTREAMGVEVFAYFSRGIEPTKAEGAANRLSPGQVTFLPIPTVAPGAEVVLKVQARAEVAGNHIFRAETHCKASNARLISEATNLYYADAPAVQTASRPVSDDGAMMQPVPQAGQSVTPPRK
jgi:uncharacterized repeat protein (TIGR01451 family)